MLPIYYGVYNFTLFCSCFSEIYTSSFDAFVPHKVSKKRYIVATLQKAFGKSVPERMRVYDDRINIVSDCQFFQLSGNAAGSDALAILVQKNEAAFLLLFSQPRKGFFLQFFGNVNPAQLSAFGVQVEVSSLTCSALI